MTELRLEHYTEQLVAALAYPLTSHARSLLFVGFAVATYLLLILSSFLEYSLQMLSADLGYLDTALVALTANTYATIGAIGLGLIVSYAIVTGIAITNVIGRITQLGLSKTGGLSSAIPGLLASGCARCGAGVLGLVGFAVHWRRCRSTAICYGLAGSSCYLRIWLVPAIRVTVRSTSLLERTN